MASTNPFQHADADAIDDVNEALSDLSARERHRLKRSSQLRGASNKRSRAKARKQVVRSNMINGWPEWQGLRPVMLFLVWPAILAIMIALFSPLPKVALYLPALIMGSYVFYSTFRTSELVLACTVLYLPFSTTYVISIAPGLNGTNALLLLGLWAALMRAVKQRQTLIGWPTGTTIVLSFGFLSALSGLTIMREPGGYAWLMYGEILSYKAWIDQFILYCIALSCIRDTAVAKRTILYMCMGAVILVFYAVPEMLDKMGNSTIEKSRIGGPLQQPNNFGGLVAYSMLPLVALFMTYIKDIRAWLLAPYFLLALKVLITTFSRGAYLAMAVGGIMAAYFKGKGFLIMWATLGICVLLVFPSLFPEAITDRLFGGAKTNYVDTNAEQLDTSSQSRLILWRAGGKMILESPILGSVYKKYRSAQHIHFHRFSNGFASVNAVFAYSRLVIPSW